LGVAGSNPDFEHPEHNVPPGPDEMLETITPTRRGNTLDPEVRNPALKGRGGVISIFELQAKSAKLNIPVNRVVEAVRVITSSFRVIPFHTQPIIEHAFELRGILGDYIDCIIVATAVSLGEDLVTEDTRILSQRKVLEEKYKIKIHSYKDLVI
jgi:predicted nucleic acid-binding protein